MNSSRREAYKSMNLAWASHANELQRVAQFAKVTKKKGPVKPRKNVMPWRGVLHGKGGTKKKKKTSNPKKTNKKKKNPTKKKKKHPPEKKTTGVARREEGP